MAVICCPFCGDTAAIDTINHANRKPAKYRVQCRKCRAATEWFDAAGGAWTAWEQRKAEIVNFVINNDVFILNNLLYMRNQPTGNCTAQKEFRGKRVRISKEAFIAAYEECVKITGAQA